MNLKSFFFKKESMNSTFLWILDLCVKNNIDIESFISFLIIHQKVNKNFNHYKPKLVSSVCFHLAFKFLQGYDEDMSFHIKDFIIYSKYEFTKKEYLDMEINVLHSLNYHLLPYTINIIPQSILHSKDMNVYQNFLCELMNCDPYDFLNHSKRHDYLMQQWNQIIL